MATEILRVINPCYQEEIAVSFFGQPFFQPSDQRNVLLERGKFFSAARDDLELNEPSTRERFARKQRPVYDRNFGRDICIGSDSSHVSPRHSREDRSNWIFCRKIKIVGRSTVTDRHPVADHGSDTSIDRSFPFRCPILSDLRTRKRVLAKCVARSLVSSIFTNRECTRAPHRGPIGKIQELTSSLSPSLLSYWERTLSCTCTRRETLRADYTVGQCEKYYPLICGAAHSVPVSLRQEINDHGPPFQYDLPSEIISRERAWARRKWTCRRKWSNNDFPWHWSASLSNHSRLIHACIRLYASYSSKLGDIRVKDDDLRNLCVRPAGFVRCHSNARLNQPTVAAIVWTSKREISATSWINWVKECKIEDVIKRIRSSIG